MPKFCCSNNITMLFLFYCTTQFNNLEHLINKTNSSIKKKKIGENKAGTYTILQKLY